MDFYLRTERGVREYIRHHGPIDTQEAFNKPASETAFVRGQMALTHSMLDGVTGFVFEGPVVDDVMSDKDVHKSVMEGLKEKVLDLPCNPCCFDIRRKEDSWGGLLFASKVKEMYMVVTFVDRGPKWDPQPLPTMLYHPDKMNAVSLAQGYLPRLKDGRDPAQLSGGLAFHWFVRCLALLNTRGIELEQTPFPRAERRRRERAGESVLPPYHVVKISHKTRCEAESAGGTHASPRLHLRRGHVRHYRSGEKIWIKPFMVGDAARGVVDKHYVVE